MPLFELSPNIQESDVSGRKRSHDEYCIDEGHVRDVRGLDVGVKRAATGAIIQPNTVLISPIPSIEGESPPPESSPASLTDAGTSTPARNSPSPNPTPTKNSLLQPPPGQQATSTASPAKPSSTTEPSAKRKRLTAAEKEALEKEKAEKKKEREEKLAAKQAEKAKADAEKQARAQERDEKRRKKEEDDRKTQEEKEKKERSQLKLNMFLKPPGTPKKDTAGIKVEDKSPNKASPASVSPLKPTKKADAISEYDRLFKPFYIKAHVRLAPNPFELDQETRDAKSKILDEYISGQRGIAHPVKPFDPLEVLQLPSKPQARGKLHHPVKHIMEKMQQECQKANKDHKVILSEARRKLSKVPMKLLSFQQDVRPPYFGTVTFKPFALGRPNMLQAARRPTTRTLPVNYEYDSEAEWQEEDGEDVDLDDEDEEDLDEDDDMNEFLDDSEDIGVARRLFDGGMEPESTGLCWENGKRLGPCATMYKHRMEFMLDNLPKHSGIDPFSKSYWEPEPRPKPPRRTKETGANPPTANVATSMPPPPPSNAFEALATTGNQDPASVAGPKKGKAKATADGPKSIASDESLLRIKQIIIERSTLTKLGMIEFLNSELEDVKRKTIVDTLAMVAERSGKPARWALRPGHELPASA